MPCKGKTSIGTCVNSKQVCILAVTLLALLINLVVIILGVYIMTSLKQHTDSQSTTAHGSHDKPEAIACFSCDKLSREMLKTFTKKKVNDTTELCCAESSSQMSALMELILRNPEADHNISLSPDPIKNTVESLEAGNFSFSKASAHKRLETKEHFNSSTDLQPVFKNHMIRLTLNPSNHEPYLEHVRGVDVLESGYKITQPGTYHVYSSVLFKPDSSHPCSSFRFQVWEHKVMKTSKQQRSELLKSVHTCCDNCTVDRETSFASGAFLLGIGDELGVDISGLGLISYRYESSYFGLMMLGSS